MTCRALLRGLAECVQPGKLRQVTIGDAKCLVP
jgi:hypothetical protein